MRKYIKTLIVTALIFTLTACAQTPISQPSSTPQPSPTQNGTGESYGNGYNFDYLCGVDQFGRAFMPSISDKKDKQVGIFYFIWHGSEPSMNGIYNNTVLLKENPQALWDKAGSAISPTNMFHYWGEPLFGYYKATDEFVLRRHIEMLTAAQIDYIAIDVTNAQTYDSAWRRLFKLLDEYQQQGWNVPKVVFMTHSYSFLTIKKLYTSIYKREYYPNLWYRPDGERPLILGNTTVNYEQNEAVTRGDTSYKPQPLSQEILDFFDLRQIQWPNVAFNANAVPWMEWTYPQPMHNGVMNVSVAQHPQLPFSDSVSIGSTNWGRGFINGENNSNYRLGQNFQRQWATVFQADPDMVFITGWNEWIALKLIIDKGRFNERVGFVDNFNEEYSRDIEPMKGGYEDAFYLQMIQNIKTFKSSGQKSFASPVRATMDINADPGQWSAIPNQYLNVSQKAYGRNEKAVDGKLKYNLPVPRNNIQEVKVTHDENNIYFMIRTENDITPYSNESNWMNLFIGVGKTRAQGWESYNYVVNRFVTGQKSTIEKLAADASSTVIGQADINLNGRYLQIAISRKLINANDEAGGIYFKVADGVENPTSIQDYYVSGKSMPMGRLSYYYFF